MAVVRKLWLYELPIEARVSGQYCILVFYIFGSGTYILSTTVSYQLLKPCVGDLHSSGRLF